MGVAIAFTAVALSACGGESTARPVAASPIAAATSCPLGVRGTVIAIRDVGEGVELTFTSRDHADEVRRRVLEVSAVHGAGAHRGVGHEGEHGIGQGHGLHLGDLPPMSAAFEEVPGGARLQLAAIDPEHASTVRDEVRRRASSMQNRVCD
jgi:hypothetical protein